jgi:6-phosphofructokinase 1
MGVNAVVCQSGGPTAVINASLAGVVEGAQVRSEIDRVFGSFHALRGIVDGQLTDLTNLSARQLESLASTPSAALGSSRERPDAKHCEQVLASLRKHGIRYFFHIGGNDSAETARIVSRMAEAAAYELICIHVPKTIDNDLPVTDHTPGFGSAARFVATGLIGEDLENRAMPGVKISVVMGRHAGFLAAATALGKSREDDGPHLIFLPERPFSMETFLARIEDVYRHLGRCVVVVGQGIRDVDGVCWDEKVGARGARDPHGNLEFTGTGLLSAFLAGQVEAGLAGQRVRADTYGYLQRSFPGLQSPVDKDEAYRCGRAAVDHACAGRTGSVAIRRTGTGTDYSSELFLTELENVAGQTRCMPGEFISEDGTGVTAAFVDYARPLAGELPKRFYLDPLA